VPGMDTRHGREGSDPAAAYWGPGSSCVQYPALAKSPGESLCNPRCRTVETGGQCDRTDLTMYTQACSHRSVGTHALDKTATHHLIHVQVEWLLGIFATLDLDGWF
jgi:hypothetical protein